MEKIHQPYKLWLFDHRQDFLYAKKSVLPITKII